MILAAIPHYQSPPEPYQQPPSFNSSYNSIEFLSSMQSGNQNTSNPTVRVHRSSPSPHRSRPQTMLAQSVNQGNGWRESFPGAGYLRPFSNSLEAGYHKRASSGSSVTTGGPPSPHNHNTIFPQIAASDNNNFSSPAYEGFDYMSTPLSANSSKSLPTPTSDATFLYHTSAPFNPMDMNMRRIQSAGGDENASYGAQSVSSMSHNSPATPHTNYEMDFDESKTAFSGQDEEARYMGDEYLHFDLGYPTAAYQQSLQDVFPNQAFSAEVKGYPAEAMAFQQAQAMSRLNNNVQHHRSLSMADRLQAAHQDHLQLNSPLPSNQGGKSPFRQNSPFAEQRRAAAAQSQQVIPTLQKTRTSVSPKELMLDEHGMDEMNATPLFPDQSPSLFANRRQRSSLSNMYTPTFSQETPAQAPQYQFMNQRSRHDSNQSGVPESSPEFPAHLNSMESTVEEGNSEPSSEQSTSEAPSHTSQPVQRPSDTSSDAGTYTCTYHGCTLRFETPARLQKHKREGHRQVSPASSASLALRNSQAGPHKCERINPSTGKPCNSVFSRPYDLTRHEDTIHNSRKQKVRCHLCTEEKTFSRSDALTRHMRVVHPEVHWPGKVSKRKNARE